jgi:PIN domain nuclease of toxin-antitoxin system
MSPGVSRNPIPFTVAKVSSGKAVGSPLLLDTHIWLWMLEGETDRISPTVIKLLKDEAKSASLLVSEISFWEIANKTAKGKLSLSIDSVIWLEKAGGAPGITYLEVERAALIQSTRLRGQSPSDPVDRILLATAQLNGASLVTCDAEIIDYGRRERGISVRDARS